MDLVAFVAPVAEGQGLPARSAALRAAAAAATPLREKSTGPGLLVPLGAAVACAGLGLAAGRRKRASAVRRRFFGGGSSPPPAPPAKSYRDFDDPWLKSADLGFDPLSFSVSQGIFDTSATAVPQTTYYNYRESEVKHGRFAMTAFLAIFFEEADRGALLKQMGVAGAQDNLDGTLGLDEVQGPVLLLGLALQAFAEYNLQKNEDDGNFLSVEYKRDRCPGDLGFDPLGFAGDSLPAKVYMHNMEVNTGRLAMIGVTSFLAKEFVLKDL